ncbi:MULTISPECIES: MFS transporter [Acinetobacter]|uniref:MFS transporter n=1 Tax=Acinetobacter TaxID=469 RepID=UPI0004D528E8|nr:MULTISPECIES: MFS transporter [Acinetobacter]MDN5488861.1 MFS transporter [Acinetobacter sp.]KEC84043.1 MFS transporter [Acinetobacter sp. ETR1]MCU4493031.1 MFS transporter [Acinetobacter guillouiae]UOH20226.1 MFS transporter [Acinetobacter sp. NyZ410]WEE37998.1 MFS transporter [Acinetobacter sp. TAC-1]
MEKIVQPDTTHILSKSFIFIMAMACGICAGSNYYNQPLIYSIAEALQVNAEQVALTIVIGQLSYAVGLFILVPLGDFFEKRSYICLLMCCTGFAQIGLSLSQSLPVLYGFTFLATFFSITTQVLVPFAAGLASPQKSPQIVGTLMSGLFLGILLARSIAGLLSTVWSWHAVYLLSGMVILAFAVVMWLKLPVARKSHQLTVLQIYRSLFTLAVDQPHLIRRGLAGGIGFGILALIFTTMTFILANAPYHFNDFQIGLFGIVGLAGVFATPWAGKQIAKGLENKVALICMWLLVLAWIPLFFAQQSLLAYAGGVILAYFGLSAFHVLNQNLVYRISAQARSRINSIYMTLYFGGAALGSLVAVYTWKHWGWSVCVAVGLAMAILSFIIDRIDFYAMKKTVIKD